MARSFQLMIHGGAGELDRVRDEQDKVPYLQSIRRIVECGRSVLKRGGSALDAVETCAVLLENDPLFNAGRGSVLDEQGRTSMDAAIMDGRNLGAGAVAGISRISNPVRLARLVLADRKHVMLAGAGAVIFARRHGIRMVPENYHLTKHRLDEYRKIHPAQHAKAAAAAGKKHGTIGAVAMDKKGNLAAATSTGGLACKSAGRVGDTPIIGAGIYADNKTCAVAATGHGEKFMRTVLAKHIADLIAFRNLDADSAAKNAIAYLRRTVNGRGGVIVIDNKGRCSARFNTRTMVHGRVSGDGEIHCAC